MSSVQKSGLTILTLNCWGTPAFTSKKRIERIPAIGEELAKGENDLVLLQELWVDTDFEVLRQYMNEVYPYSHHFKNGVVGAGLAVFSKFPIEEVMFFPYKLNGYPHKVLHGDFFGGKGIGLCVVRWRGLSLHVFVTHLHAEYGLDDYLAHRVDQCLATANLVRLSRPSADVTVLGGDLNLEPGDLGLDLILHRSGLRDSWQEQSEEARCCVGKGGTCDVANNTFATDKMRREIPDGKRLDYVLYGSNKGVAVDCVACDLPMGKVPGRDFSFSDHEAVRCRLQVAWGEGVRESLRRTPLPDPSVYGGATSVVKQALTDVARSQRLFIAAGVVVLALSILLDIYQATDMLFRNQVVFTLLELGLVAAGLYLLMMGVLFSRAETRALVEMREELQSLHRRATRDD